MLKGYIISGIEENTLSSQSTPLFIAIATIYVVLQFQLYYIKYLT